MDDKPSEFNAWQIGREVFPELDDSMIGYILWNYTGFPCFFDGDPATELRQQLEEYKRNPSKFEADQ